MSDIASKLEAPFRPTEGRARRTLRQLQASWGYRVLEGTEAKPKRVRTDCMETESRWRRVSQDMFEREDP